MEQISKEPELVAAPAPLTINQKPALPENYGHVSRVPLGIVLHCTEGHEGEHQADNVSAMFAGTLTNRRSANYVVDSGVVDQCVPDLMTAWHCGHHGNQWGIGIEICGTADQTRAEWLDAQSLPTLALAVRLVADLCAKYQIPRELLDEKGLLAGKSGITTHASVSLAWRETNHTDPGVNFPLDAFIAAVIAAQ